jgi:double-strand break repair protein MRE11
VVVDQPELSIDDPELSISEKISRLRVQTLVKEFLGAQELQLLGEHAMSAAIETFVDKDDTHAIQTYVSLPPIELFPLMSHYPDTLLNH